MLVSSRFIADDRKHEISVLMLENFKMQGRRPLSISVALMDLYGQAFQSSSPAGKV